jgi:hypothetical protein
MDEAAKFLERPGSEKSVRQLMTAFASLGSKSGWKAMLAVTARPSFVPRRGPFQRLIVEGLASALGRVIEDPELRRRPGEDGAALHRAQLDIEVCAERLVSTRTESVHAGER